MIYFVADFQLLKRAESLSPNVSQPESIWWMFTEVVMSVGYLQVFVDQVALTGTVLGLVTISGYAVGPSS